MKVLGFSIGARGSASCLVQDGRVLAAAREEWFSRVAFDASAPQRSAEYCLEAAGLESGDVDAVVRAGKSEKRLAALSSWFSALSDNKAESGLSLFARSSRHPITSAQPVPESSAAAGNAFYPSPFAEAAILVMNGPGQGVGTVLAEGRGNAIRVLAETPSPHGPGALYAALAARLGRRYPQDEAELWDLARLGRPRLAQAVRREWLEVLDDGTCRVRRSDTGTVPAEFFGPAGEERRASFSEHEMDLARSVQAVFEDVVLHAARRLRRTTGLSRLAFGGDAALNASAVGRLLREGIFDDVWIPASPADEAIGAALHTWYRSPERVREPGATPGYLGPVFTVPALESYLTEARIASQRHTAEDLIVRVAAALADGRVVGWFQGHMCAGPHGLAARAILADPRSESVRHLLNTRIKRRGPFRTFMASATAERAGEMFELCGSVPHAFATVHLGRPRVEAKDRRKSGRGAAVNTRERPSLPSVLQADGTVCLRIVERKKEPLFHALLEVFGGGTDCPVLLTDSLCLESEPTVASPRDAYAFFMRSDLDYLAMGPFLLDKRQQPLWEDRSRY
jgi:carbamoyltransferase